MNIQTEDIKKAHRTGLAQDDKENIIIKFTKDSTASHIYQSCGKLKDSRANHKGVKIRTSLTMRQQNLPNMVVNKILKLSILFLQMLMVT